MTPNNDGDERHELRRQSASKVLRRSLGGKSQGMGGLPAVELQSMYERVIKLTAENKITKNNVWDLNIIYHMPAIVRSVTSPPFSQC